MTRKTKVWPVKSPIGPDIVQWRAQFGICLHQFLLFMWGIWLVVVLKETQSRGCMHHFLKSKLEKFSLNFSSWSVNLKIASTSDGGHRGNQIKPGQKKILEKHWDGKRYLKNIGTEKDIWKTLGRKKIFEKHWDGKRYSKNIGTETDICLLVCTCKSMAVSLWPCNFQECQKSKFKKNFKFHFVKYWKTNSSMQKYCRRGFIWMVTP